MHIPILLEISSVFSKIINLEKNSIVSRTLPLPGKRQSTTTFSLSKSIFTPKKKSNAVHLQTAFDFSS